MIGLVPLETAGALATATAIPVVLFEVAANPTRTELLKLISVLPSVDQSAPLPEYSPVITPLARVNRR